MYQTISILNHHNTTFKTSWNFDAFMGLPEPTAKDKEFIGEEKVYKEGELVKTIKHECPSCWKGSWNPQGPATSRDPKEVQRFAMRFINFINSTSEDYHYQTGFVVGFYNESLTPTLASQRGMKPALYVDIDCDLYDSSWQALDWLFASGLMVQGPTGTFVYFDDWTGSDGQRQAEADIDEKYSVVWKEFDYSGMYPKDRADIFPNGPDQQVAEEFRCFRQVVSYSLP
eukprot:gnl/TRDRNA2_/TRDRNA2_170484_c4_seq2.p1 gnl/TRDRNA2_/TRDRNA2_170484_c4~~gnl/TRDRNA2_/TRDRNA2_170484_c4_seq2.p1  ORF type:complete len:228 (-),score=23.38 gnl/TRDRNA2_/TRDRNA2_170484_c4_seq2:96-779(-)